MITTNIRAVRQRLAGLKRQLPDAVLGAINNLGPERKFAASAKVRLNELATEEEKPLVDLFVETVWIDFKKRGISVTMHAPQVEFSVRIARLEQLTGTKGNLAISENLRDLREAVRQWVLTDKELDPRESANTEIAVARVWHILGIHPDSTKVSRDRQFEVSGDGSIALNPWGDPSRDGDGQYTASADLDAGAEKLLASQREDGLPAALQRAGIGGMDATLVDRWLRAVLVVWVAYARSTLEANFRREIRRIWKTLGRR